jgi:hypothetical protein
LYSSISGSLAASKICRWNFVFVRPSDSGRHHIGQVFVSTHHGNAREIERLPRQIRQLLLRVDLRAPLGEDRFEILYCLVVGVERFRLWLRERCALTSRQGNEAQIADIERERDHIAEPAKSDCRQKTGTIRNPH